MPLVFVHPSGVLVQQPLDLAREVLGDVAAGHHPGESAAIGVQGQGLARPAADAVEGEFPEDDAQVGAAVSLDGVEHGQGTGAMSAW